MTGFPNTTAWQKACAADAVLTTWAGPWAVCFAVRSGSDTAVFNFVGGQIADDSGTPAFTLAAPESTWARFLEPVPPRHHYGIFAMIYRLPEFVQEQLKKTITALQKNNGLTLVLALSYGGRTEIVETIRKIAAKVKLGKLDPEEINEQTVTQHLYTKGIPDPDLLIRTSGEMRVSNFLLWQISYAELVVTPTLWPDFRKPQLHEALEEYARRHRRFGAL